MKDVFPVKALITEVDEEEKYVQTVQSKEKSFFPKHELNIKVLYSSLNYKDVLSAFGKNRVTKDYPHITGIDAAGIVISDSTDRFQAGDEVVVTGFDLGMCTFGGHAQYLSVPANWAIAKPSGLSLYECMCLGTAGVTVGLSWLKMQPYLAQLKKQDFIITGASGGVGSIATILLSDAGFNIIAASSKSAAKEKLIQLGAKDVIHPSAILSDKPLRKPLWGGGLDTLGGNYLTSILSAAHKESCIVSVGLAASATLAMTVLPFILNGVHLLGINTADTPMEQRAWVWKYLASKKDILSNKLFPSVEEVSLSALPKKMEAMYTNKQIGRIVVTL